MFHGSAFRERGAQPGPVIMLSFTFIKFLWNIAIDTKVSTLVKAAIDGIQPINTKQATNSVWSVW